MSYISDKWDNRFLDLARNISQWSKDKSTKVGCVLIGKNKEILSTGYNGLPRGAVDDVPARDSRPEKYFWYEHAERNAIYNSAKIGVPLEGGTAYVTLCPCMDCARGLVQSGIRRVVCSKLDTKTGNDIKWMAHFDRTMQLLFECSVEITFL